MAQRFYAVARGKVPGVYKTWPECESQIVGFPAPRFKKFDNEADALAFIEEHKVKGVSKKGAASLKSEKDSADPQGTSTGSSKRKRAAADDEKDTAVAKKVCTSGDAGNATVEKWIAEGVPVVYTDGSCLMNGMKGPRAGYGVYWGDEHPDNVSEPLSTGPPTNNRAELTAVIAALQQAEKKGLNRLVVKTDSSLLIQSMNSWIHSWRKNGWKTSAGTDVKNKDLLVELDSHLQNVQVCFEHVRGHAGESGNEKADELARNGASRYVSAEKNVTGKKKS